MTTATTTAVQKRSEATPISVEEGRLVFADHTEMYRAAKQVATSGIIPKDFQGKPDNVFVAWMKGAEYGFSPMQSLDSIVVINGRASLYAEAMTALVLNSGLCEDHVCKFSGQGKTRKAHCITKRAGIPTPHESIFSIADAETAQLVSNANYKKYPDAMLMARAKSSNYRIQFPDVIKGMHSAEEMSGVPAGRGQSIRQNATPSRVINDPLIDAESDIIDAEATPIEPVAESTPSEPVEKPTEEPVVHPAVTRLAELEGVAHEVAFNRIDKHCSGVRGKPLDDLDDAEVADLLNKIDRGDITIKKD